MMAGAAGPCLCDLGILFGYNVKISRKIADLGADTRFWLVRKKRAII